MFRRGRRLFSGASIGLIVVAILHTLGNFAKRPPDPAQDALEQAMRSYRFALGFWKPSADDILRSLSLTMSVLLLCLGAANLAVAGARDASDALVRRLGFVSALGVGALVALYALYRVPPPFLTLGVVEILFVSSLVRRSPGEV